MDDAQLLAQELDSESLPQRRRAARMLAFLGDLARPAAVSMVKHLSCDDEDVRNWLTEAIENLGPPLIEQRHELAEQIQQAQDSLIVTECCRLLSRLGHQAGEAIPVIILRLKQTTDTAEQLALMKTLSKITAVEQAEEVGAFIDSLPLDDDPSLQLQRQRTLEQLERLLN